MTDEFEARLRAVERALVEGEPPSSLETAAELAARVERVEDRLDDLAERQLATEAAVQALRGYVGQARSVNREVERQAEAALATAEAVEAAVGDDVTVPGDPPVTVPPPTADGGGTGGSPPTGETADRARWR